MRYFVCFILILNLFQNNGFFVNSASVSLDRTPFCGKCHCYNHTLNNPDVDCSETAIINDLYEFQNWFDPKNASYSIQSLNLQNNNLIKLDKEFLNSSLTRLDLSHNKLSQITDEVFVNLAKLDVLILSFNQLSDLTPNVFKVFFRFDYN